MARFGLVRKLSIKTRIAVSVLLLVLVGFWSLVLAVMARQESEFKESRRTEIAQLQREIEPVKNRVTASMLRIEKRHIKRLVSFSRDMAVKHKFGQRFYLVVGGKIFDVEFQDIMNKKHRRKIDLLLGSKKECLEFGIKKGTLVPIRWE